MKYFEIDISEMSQATKDLCKKFGGRDLYYFKAMGTEEHTVAIPLDGQEGWDKLSAEFRDGEYLMPYRICSGDDYPTRATKVTQTYDEWFAEREYGKVDLSTPSTSPSA